MSSKLVSPEDGAGHVPERTIDELLREIAELRAALDARTQENTLLNEVISTVGSTLKLDVVLRHLVDTLVRAISCHAAFIYLFNRDKERLILASTSEPYSHLVGKIELALGEGITGWVGMTLQPVILKEEAMNDPRFRYFPELEEEKFQSTMTVPIVAKDRHLIGIITMHTAAPYEFTEQHQVFVSNTAALAARAIENAQLYESTQRKLNILTNLSVLSQTISSGQYLDDMLRSLATLTAQIIEVDLCVIMLLDSTRGRLTVRASSPHLSDRALSFRTIDIDRQAWDKLRVAPVQGAIELKGAPQASLAASTSPQGQLSETSTHVLEHLNPVKDSHYKSLLSLPLIAGTEHLGLINCYSSKARRYTAEDSTLLSTIANQVALAIKNSHLVDLLAQKNLIKGFFDDLAQGTYDSEDTLRQRANFLGCDLSRPHAIVTIEIAHVDAGDGEEYGYSTAQHTQSRESSGRGVHLEEQRGAREWKGAPQAPHLRAEQASQVGASSSTRQVPTPATTDRLETHKRISGQIRRRLLDNFPGSLVYERENLLTCIVCLSKDPSGSRLKTWLRDLFQQMRNEHKVHLSAGIGNICRNASDYRRGFAEAGEALQMGQSLNREGDVTHFNDLGVYRYLYKIARMDDLRDMYQDQVGRIANYDARKGTDLLDTLETYLECAGNLTRTSNRLYVHRNTLIQRLDRLQSLCDIDLQERSNWLTLQVAIKVYKLRNGA
ncbi:MAG TPA: GAF domain-containing protein [Ktedonobacteraceae bacterium]|nr:GAF domain-containing protein [Ktedonobacteraceae bacterium]